MLVAGKVGRGQTSLLVIAVALFLVPAANAFRRDSQLEGFASAIAGHPVAVICLSRREVPLYAPRLDTRYLAGYTFLRNPGTIFIINPGCAWLDFLKRDPDGSYAASLGSDREDYITSQEARWLAVLAHEAWHARGEADEGLAECRSLAVLAQAFATTWTST